MFSSSAHPFFQLNFVPQISLSLSLQSPDGRTVASAAGDELLLFWNVFWHSTSCQISRKKKSRAICLASAKLQGKIRSSIDSFLLTLPQLLQDFFFFFVKHEIASNSNGTDSPFHLLMDWNLFL